MPDKYPPQVPTPGVYVTELDAFPPSVVGVQTAVPAFIGYTEKAQLNGKSVLNQPIAIRSLADYEATFGTGCQPTYDLVPVTATAEIEAGDYDIAAPDPDPRNWLYDRLGEASSAFHLYPSVGLFYANGGGTAYVVSVGTYSAVPGVRYDDLSGGVAAAGEISGPTMLVVPDSVLLPCELHDTSPQPDGFAKLTREMLKQAAELQDRVAILDVRGGWSPTPERLDAVIARFREDVGTENLSYGASYFPFLDTTLVQAGDFSYGNLTSKALARLQQILGRENRHRDGGGSVPDCTATPDDRYCQMQKAIDALTTTAADSAAGHKLDRELQGPFSSYGKLLAAIVARATVLPASGAIAGLFATVDQTSGVWNAPANIALAAVKGPTFKLDDAQQGPLNAPVDGKAVNAIRQFIGRGTVVWGARTLDGNSNDYRYVQVRRTLIYIQQSIQAALKPFGFAANDRNTWTAVVSMLSNFLQGIWTQAGLMGATASEAFTVQCGLGTTMTAQDVQDGYIIVQVSLQMIRPAEAIELTFKQKMEGVG